MNIDVHEREKNPKQQTMIMQKKLNIMNDRDNRILFPCMRLSISSFGAVTEGIKI